MGWKWPWPLWRPAASQRRTPEGPAPDAGDRPPRVPAGEPVLGIDLGTTNSVVAVQDGRAIRVIPNEYGETITPSVVAFTERGGLLVGEPARRGLAVHPNTTICSIKRLMGRCRREVEIDGAVTRYELAGAPDEYVRVRVNNREYTPAEISAMILRRLKESAERHLGRRCDRAVLTVPAYFSDAQRQATKAAGEIAGLDVVRILNEPTAAALACGTLATGESGAKCVVVHFGGGTFDVSVVEAGDGIVEVLSTNGDTQLGGDDMDALLVGRLFEQIAESPGGWRAHRDADGKRGFDERAVSEWLRQAAEAAKRELSGAPTAEISLLFLDDGGGGNGNGRNGGSGNGSGGGRYRHISITRDEFERLIAPLLERCRAVIQAALEDSRLSPEDMAEVVLAGGSTRIPSVQDLVCRMFPRSRIRANSGNELVAMGAAIQGAILSGDERHMLLLDVAPLSLGIETEGGRMTVLVPRNTTIPTIRKETFTTAADDQEVVTVRVFQGERPMAADNRLLGELKLEDIAPAPRGRPQIEVTFEIDVDGILNVSARDLATDRQQSARVDASGALNPADVARLRREIETRSNGTLHDAAP